MTSARDPQATNVPERNSWFVITGGPSSGKTTVINRLHKMGMRVVPEQARAILDEEMVAGRSADDIRADGEWFQQQILERQLARESELEQGETVFFDRGVPDGLAYERFLNLIVDPALAAAARRASYRRVFVLDPLPLHDDGSRIEDDEDQRGIHDAIVATYAELGFDTVAVPGLPVDERVAFIRERL
ncbi:MAG: AAA family ATPase [Actinobacteria bacterium]|uniref:Unannotated protein n=1 Tax=freshwater metagenome TaxID=449393 RepID=A0A6J7FIW1_9ZZZZ|nr:AAA family ATPase [Actinomycetota bacterium]